MTIPYTYLIGWSWLDIWYYGVRYEKGCHPNDLWKRYFTSSDYVAIQRWLYGEPDIIEIRKIFDNSLKASVWEEKAIRRMNMIDDLKWLNLQNAGRNFSSTKVVNRIGFKFGKDNPNFGNHSPQKKETNERRRQTMIQKYESGEIARVFGKVDSEETTQKRREANAGKNNGMFGKNHSTETKLRLGQKIKDWYDHNINPQKGKKKKRIICENCSKEIDTGNYIRWHGDKCKMVSKTTPSEIDDFPIVL